VVTARCNGSAMRERLGNHPPALPRDGYLHTQEVDAILQTMGEEARNRFWQLVPSGRLGTPEEYAATVVHLVGEHYLVGQVISPTAAC
jgi:NAD(P)-dependent dehydrogenase (short-subunit alcohol dehydrogenase family)